MHTHEEFLGLRVEALGFGFTCRPGTPYYPGYLENLVVKSNRDDIETGSTGIGLKSLGFALVTA